MAIQLPPPHNGNYDNTGKINVNIIKAIFYFNGEIKDPRTPPKTLVNRLLDDLLVESSFNHIQEEPLSREDNLLFSDIFEDGTVSSLIWKAIKLGRPDININDIFFDVENNLSMDDESEEFIEQLNETARQLSLVPNWVKYALSFFTDPPEILLRVPFIRNQQLFRFAIERSRSINSGQFHINLPEPPIVEIQPQPAIVSKPVAETNEYKNELVDRIRCKICMENESDIVLIPCGHIICGSCASRVDKCPICRANIRNKTSIYYQKYLKYKTKYLNALKNKN